MALAMALATGACRSSDEKRAKQTPATATPTTAAVRAVSDQPADAPPPMLDARPMTVLARPGAMGANLAVHQGELLLSWLEPAETPAAGQADKPPMRLRMARTENGVLGPARTVVESPHLLANWADFPSLIAAPGDQIVAYYMHLVDPETFAYDLMVAHSSDGGQTFRPLGKAYADPTHGEHGFASSVRDGDGVRVFWLDGRDMGTGHGHGSDQAGAMTLRTTMIRGQEIADDEPIDSRVCDCCGTDAAMTDAGPIVVYRDRSEDEVRDISYVVRRDGAWSEPAPVHRDGWTVSGCPVNGPRVVARGSQVAVAWYTYADDRARVRVAFSDDAGASFAAPLDIDAPSSARAPLGRVDLVLAPERDRDRDDDAAPMEVIVTWMASQRERAMVLARRASADRRLGAVAALVETRAGRSAGFPRMARIQDRLHAAWVEISAGHTAVRAARFDLQDIPALGHAPGQPDAPATNPGLVPVGRAAPAYAATTLDGQRVSLADRRDGPVLLNVWATWCEPCRHELPELATLHREYAPRGLRVIGVSVDQMRSPAEIRTFVERKRVPYEIWHDADDRASIDLGVAILPASLLIDGNGQVRYTESGTIRADDEELRAAIEAALGPAKPDE